MFVANGGAGILVSKYTELENDPYQEYGYFDFGGPVSSNYVKSEGNFIFVASGLGGLKILSFEEQVPFECTTWDEETAFAGATRGTGGGAWWYYFIASEGTAPIFAGQNRIPGASVTFSNGVLTIDLGPFMRLQNVDEPVKIQGYNEGELPARRPAAGQFTTYKGNGLVVEVGNFKYFVIHLDVEVCQEYPNIPASGVR